MNISSPLFSYIAETYLLPLVPIAKRGEIIFREQYPDALDLNKNIQVLEFVDNTGQFTSHLYMTPQSMTGVYYYVAPLSCTLNSIKTISTVLNEISASLRSFSYNEHDARFHFYFDSLCAEACMMGICQSVTAHTEEATLAARIIEALAAWSLKAYEGRKVPFGIIIDFNENDSVNYRNNYLSFLNSKNSAAFTDGVFSAILLNSSGNIIRHLSLRSQNAKNSKKSQHSISLSPTRFSSFSIVCQDNRLGIMLLTNGDILIFRQAQLQFARREGRWIAYNYSAFVRPCLNDLLQYKSHKNRRSTDNNVETLSKCVYITMLDVSFAHTGACLAILDFASFKSQIEEILGIGLIEHELSFTPDMRFTHDQLSQLQEKQAVIRQLIDYRLTSTGRLITKKLSHIEDKLRIELLSLDGATVIDKAGYLRAVGSILSVKPGSEEGGRMAAARTLSQYGFAVKISEDGAITGLYHEKECFRMG